MDSAIVTLCLSLSVSLPRPLDSFIIFPSRPDSSVWTPSAFPGDAFVLGRMPGHFAVGHGFPPCACCLTVERGKKKEGRLRGSKRSKPTRPGSAWSVSPPHTLIPHVFPPYPLTSLLPRWATTDDSSVSRSGGGEAISPLLLTSVGYASESEVLLWRALGGTDTQPEDVNEQVLRVLLQDLCSCGLRVCCSVFRTCTSPVTHPQPLSLAQLGVRVRVHTYLPTHGALVKASDAWAVNTRLFVPPPSLWSCFPKRFCEYRQASLSLSLSLSCFSFHAAFLRAVFRLSVSLPLSWCCL